MHGLQAPRGTRSLRVYRPLLLAAVAVVAADQVTKTIALDRLADGPVDVIEGVLRWRLTFNPGGAFGIGRDFPLFFLGATVVVTLGILLWARRLDERRLVVPLGLVLGGGAGNLIDRVARDLDGRVVDFIDLHVWPVFNVADASIVTGVALVLLFTARGGRSGSADADDENGPGAGERGG